MKYSTVKANYSISYDEEMLKEAILCNFYLDVYVRLETRLVLTS